MCLICVEWEAGKLTSKEAFRNVGEQIYATEDEEVKRHLFDLSDRILDKDLGKVVVDDEMDEAWQKENTGQ